MDIDYEDALVGASLTTLARASRDLVHSAGRVGNQAELRKVAHMAAVVGSAFRARAEENVDIASKAGLLPTNYLGVDSNRQFPAGILAGTTQTVNVNPSVDVRITGFRTDDTFAGDFTIARINVATLDLIVGQDGCPASMFTSGISLPPVAAPKLPGGSAAEVNFANISGAARRARAAFPVIKLQSVGCA